MINNPNIDIELQFESFCIYLYDYNGLLFDDDGQN